MHRVVAAMANGFFSGAQGTEAFQGWRARLDPSSCSAQSRDGVFGVVKAPWEPWWCRGTMWLCYSLCWWIQGWQPPAPTGAMLARVVSLPRAISSSWELSQ